MKKDISKTKIGLLGGGQLGRMLLQQAIGYDLNISVLDPDPNAPCAFLARNFQVGKLTDEKTVFEWGRHFDLITIEIENVNVDALKNLQNEGIKICPAPDVIELIQDKREQKKFYKKNNIPTAEYVLVENQEDIKSHLSDFLPAVNKLGKGGYDGRGVQTLNDEKDWVKGFDKPGILEKKINIQKELSVLVAMNEKGDISCFPPVELSYYADQNVVDFLFSPASITNEIENLAFKLAKQVIEKLNMVGVLAVEMFLTKQGKLLVNEVAPRVHNSYHHTIEANVTSQYDQFWRTVLNLPLGATNSLIPAAMVNLLGEDGFFGNVKYKGLEKALSNSGVFVHIYGKKETRPFRKMGHVTLIHEDMNQLVSLVKTVKKEIRVYA